MSNRAIVRMMFGSHLYGTSTPASDLDFKSIFVPDARSILLQQVKGAINHQREKDLGEKNSAGDIDEQKFSIQRFLGLAAEGQTIALDMLFAPNWAMVGDPSGEWHEIIANRHRLLTSKSAAFVGYARTQANKFGVKGSRVAASRAALAFLDAGMQTHGTTAKLMVVADSIDMVVAEHEHMAILKHPTTAGGEQMLWEVCDRKMPLTASIKNAYDMMKRVVDEYGKRALTAETQQGVDWKALSHAVRVAEQAVELLSTGQVTFPLVHAAHITDIKLGKVPYRDVADEIDELLVKVEAAAEASSLPAKADQDWIESFLIDVHSKEVFEVFGQRANGGEGSSKTLEARALDFATRAHASIDQRRKYSGEPYIVHPIAVAEIVRSVPHTPEMIAAAYLHDTIEDTPTTAEDIRREFGTVVGDMVDWLTDVSKPSDGNRKVRKQIDLEHMAKAPPAAKTIKLADLIDNSKSIAVQDPDFWKVYRHEKIRLLEVLQDGDPSLLTIAKSLVDE